MKSIICWWNILKTTLKCGKTYHVHGLGGLILSILPKENYRFSQKNSNNVPQSMREKQLWNVYGSTEDPKPTNYEQKEKNSYNILFQDTL